MEFHGLRVASKVFETADSASFLLEIPENLKDVYKHKSGQYLTLKLEVNGEELRRAYSIFTAPFEDRFGFTVKRLKGGKVSNFLIDHVNEGDSLEVMEPEGKFILDATHNLQRDHYFISGGSGITPIMAMIRTVLEEEPLSKAYLLYCNRNEDAIIFEKALESLEEKYKGQLVVLHNLSQPKKQKAGGIKGLLGKKSTSWTGWKGRLDAGKLQRFFDEHPTITKDDHYYLCGPGGLIEMTEDFLTTRGIPEDRIHKEYFTTSDLEPKAKASGDTTECVALVTLNDEEFEVVIPKDKTVLEAILDSGKDAPYSCTSGACSTCVAKVTEGEVEMDACFALDDEEIKQGYVLTCQSRAKTSKLKVIFES
jgi:ring-1,2-phenylacetyl-CoA epoxidase subunit PaaE